MSHRLILTCEHGGRRVPPAWRHLFPGASTALHGHRGHDAGALELARFLSRSLEVPLFASTVTRLLVDLNRSRHHPRLLSEFSRTLPRAERQQLIDAMWRPFRSAVRREVAATLRRGRSVIHLAVHSFTPVLGGRRRNADLGLLYDPGRRREQDLCRRWKRYLDPPGAGSGADGVRVRLNYPYRGTADGHTTALRRHFPARLYLGLELEVNQSWPRGARAPWRRLQRRIRDSLRAALG